MHVFFFGWGQGGGLTVAAATAAAAAVAKRETIGRSDRTHIHVRYAKVSSHSLTQAVIYWLVGLHFALGIARRNVYWSRPSVCVYVCLSVPHCHTTARPRM